MELKHLFLIYCLKQHEINTHTHTHNTNILVSGKIIL